MPVFEINKINPSTTIGLWEIQEDVDFLFDQLNLSKEDLQLYHSFANDTRRKHWLSYRNLINTLIPNALDNGIRYDENGKPFLEGKSHHLSVSHAGSYSAAIISNTNQVGIDIEVIHPRIEKITEKYLNNYEIENLGSEFRLEKLYVLWSAKEALYKMYGKRNLLFKEHMKIEPFVFSAGGGELSGRISNAFINHNYRLYYKQLNQYILVYVIDEDNSINL